MPSTSLHRFSIDNIPRAAIGWPGTSVPANPFSKDTDVAEICDELWKFNLAHIVVIDVSDDYELMQPPLPSECYPVLKELWMPKYRLIDSFPRSPFVEGYLYDWHEMPEFESGDWYVGVVRSDLGYE